MRRRVLVLGAASAIAEELCRLLARDGDRLFLVGRDADRLRVIAEDLRVRGAEGVECACADLGELARHAELLEAARGFLGTLDTVVVAYGILGEQTTCQASFEAARAVLHTNFVSVVSLLTPLANELEAAGHGTIVVLGSVAGDRGRSSNYVYGASKGALAIFLQGLRGRLHSSGVQVLTVKPGFVDTPMTAHLERGLLFASPSRVAAGIRRAMQRRRDVVYLPGFWRWILFVIRHIPERVYKRLRI